MPGAALGLCAVLFAASCAHNGATSGKTYPSSAQEVSAERHAESGSDSRATIPSSNPGISDEERSHGFDDSLEAELERVRAGNAFLSEENSRLRSEVIRLNEALVEAGQTIYSLNRKLDAIFKPEAEGE